VVVVEVEVALKTLQLITLKEELVVEALALLGMLITDLLEQ
jgi:hypothetical protein